MRWRDLTRAIVALIDEELNDTRVRLRHMIERAVVDRIVDSTGFQELTVQIHEGDDPVEGERFQDGGLYHHPNAGAEAIVLRLGGNAAHAVMLAVAERALRPKGKAAGGTGLYPTSGAKAGQLVVWIDPTTGVLHLGSDDAADYVALASKVDAAIAALVSAVSTGLSAVGTEGGASGPTGATAFEGAAEAILPTGSTQVKSD